MASEYPKWNDNEIDLLRHIAENSALLADAEAGDVASVAGTANQVLVNGGTAAATGAVVLSLPAAVTVTTSVSTGILYAANGTTLLPSHTFTSDPTAGMLYAGSGGVKIATSGLQAVLFSGVDQSTTFSGRVIGTGSLNAFNVAAGITPFSELEVDSTSTSSPRGIMSAQFNTGTDGARFHGRKARGTRAAPTTVVTGDNITRWVGAAYDGTSYLEMASIIFGTEGTIGTGRVPTTITFQTGTNAATSVLTTALTINSSQQSLFAAGSAALPAVSLAAYPTTGFYQYAANSFGFAANGSYSLRFEGSGEMYGVGSQYLGMPSTGAININASGTNQNITLTPSGTGYNSFANGNVVGGGGTLTGATGMTLAYVSGSNRGEVVARAGATLKGMYFNAASASNGYTFDVDSASALRLTGSAVMIASPLLVGGLGTIGTGQIQLPAATTAAGGITFGTDVNVYRNAANNLTINANRLIQTSTSNGTPGAPIAYFVGLNSDLEIYADASNTYIGPFTNTGLKFVSNNGTVSLTIDTSQNITTGGVLTTTGELRAGTSVRAAAASSFYWTGLSRIFAPSDGVIELTDLAATSFSRLQFGGTTSSFPALRRTSSALDVRVADDTAYATLNVLQVFTADGTTKLSNGALVLGGTGTITKPGGTVALITTNTAITSGAGAQVGTLTNSPTAGNPTKWVPIDDNGTTRYIPAW